MDYSYSYQNGATRDTDFQKLAHTITTSIQKISQNVSSMQKLVSQLGTPQETPQIKNLLQDLQHYTKQLVKDTATGLQDLNKITNAPSPSDWRQWKLQRERLTEEFTDVLNRFQQAQRNAVQREKESLQRDRANSGLAFSLDEPPGGTSNLIELQSSRQQTLQQMEDEVNLRMLQDQERGIMQLENDIQSVNEIFKTLGQLVHDQGELVDSIEAHVELGASQVHEAASQLRMASNYQSKSRKKKFCLIMTCIVVLTVLILIIVFTR